MIKTNEKGVRIVNPLYAGIGLAMGILFTDIKGYYFAAFWGTFILIIWIILDGIYKLVRLNE
jgi:hypothetical protein